MNWFETYRLSNLWTDCWLIWCKKTSTANYFSVNGKTVIPEKSLAKTGNLKRASKRRQFQNISSSSNLLCWQKLTIASCNLRKVLHFFIAVSSINRPCSYLSNLLRTNDAFEYVQSLCILLISFKVSIYDLAFTLSLFTFDLTFKRWNSTLNKLQDCLCWLEFAGNLRATFFDVISNCWYMFFFGYFVSLGLQR